MSTKEKELKEFTAEAISVTPQASERIKKSMKIEDKENWGLRMSVEQGGCSGMSYKMSFDEKRGKQDKVFESSGLTIFCDINSWLYVRGIEVDFSDDMLNGGLRYIIQMQTVPVVAERVFQFRKTH